jgi:fermentation-respiration switch protein FrsA (DUF1100 family)
VGLIYLLILLFAVIAIYCFLSYEYAKKLIKAGVQRGYNWYDTTGHRLMNPAAFANVEKSRRKLEHQASDFWESGEKQTIKSHDGLKLNGRLFRQKNAAEWVIGIHDYRSTGKRDLSFIGQKYFEQGYNVLIPDLRAHGESEGEIIGMGWLDRLDLIGWINLILEEHPEASIIFHGESMGASAIMMMSGEKLPKQVKGFILDSGYVSVYAELRYMLSKLTRFPKWLIMRYANRYAQKYAGYSLKQASATRQLGSNHLPILILHGEYDHFVPVEAAYTVYGATAGKKELFLIPKSEHLEAAARDSEAYWQAVFTFINKEIK